MLGVEELPDPGPAKASDAAETLIVRSVSDDPRLVLLCRLPDEGTVATGEARRIRGRSDVTVVPFRFGRPGQFASISGSEIGTDVPLLETVDEASESKQRKKMFLITNLQLTVNCYPLSIRFSLNYFHFRCNII